MAAIGVEGWSRLSPAREPPPPHVLDLLGAAGQFPAIASRFASGFDDPRDFFEWLMEPSLADAYLAEVASA
jgi:hypothetical protein